MTPLPAPAELIYAIGMAAVAVNAASAVLETEDKKMDLVGAVVVGLATSLGGGTLRDLLLGVPVFWMIDFNYVWVASAASLAAFALARHLRDETVWAAILYLDAFGIALFGVQSIDKALAHGFAAPVAIVMATITGIGGGLIRDVLAQRENLLSSREIYATTIITGGMLYTFLLAQGGASHGASLCGVAFTFAFRGLAIHFGWQMPKWLTLRH